MTTDQLHELPFDREELIAILEFARVGLKNIAISESIGEEMDLSCDYLDSLHEKLQDYMCLESFLVDFPPEVHLTVSGGVVELENKPEGLIVKIKDYDVEGVDPDKLLQDASGENYNLQQYE